MDEQLIYVKTPAGEEAMRKPTRLVQRNLRMVLIAVDGLANVAELARQVGDRRMVDASLAELERLGLIRENDGPGARASRSRRDGGDHSMPSSPIPRRRTMAGPASAAQDGKPDVWEVVLGEPSGDERPTQTTPDPDSI